MSQVSFKSKVIVFLQPNTASSNVKLILTKLSSPLRGLLELVLVLPPNPEKPEKPLKPPPKISCKMSPKSISSALKPE